MVYRIRKLRFEEGQMDEPEMASDVRIVEVLGSHCANEASQIWYLTVLTESP